MSAVFCRSLILVAASLASQIYFGSTVKIDVTTQYHDGVIPNAFNIRCSPRTDPTCAMSIISIQLVKDGHKRIANIQSNNVISTNRLLESSVVAEGRVDRDLSKTYLSVTIKEAVAEDSGLYSCKLLYMDQSLKFEFVTASQNVTITDQDTQDIIKHLMSKISFMENLVQFQQGEMSEMKTKLVEQGAQLQSYGREINQTKLTQPKINQIEREIEGLKNENMVKETQVQGHISVLRSQVEVQELTLKQLCDKENTTVNFMAVHSGNVAYKKGEVLVYDDVVVNEGGGYDGNTGVFTAAVPGYYLLHLSVFSKANTWMYVDLKTGAGQQVFRFFTGDKDAWEDYSDASFVHEMKAGDQVMPVMSHLSDKFGIRVDSVKNRHSKFYGFLLKAL